MNLLITIIVVWSSFCVTNTAYVQAANITAGYAINNESILQDNEVTIIAPEENIYVFIPQDSDSQSMNDLISDKEPPST